MRNSFLAVGALLVMAIVGCALGLRRETGLPAKSDSFKVAMWSAGMTVLVLLRLFALSSGALRERGSIYGSFLAWSIVAWSIGIGLYLFVYALLVMESTASIRAAVKGGGGGTLRRRVFILAACATVAFVGAGQIRKEMRRERAESPRATIRDLQRLFTIGVTTKDRFLLKALAKNPSTPPDLLAQLARLGAMLDDQAGWLRDLLRNDLRPVRVVVASHSSTPPEVLRELAGSANPEVRRAAADNPRTPPEVLAALTRDSDLSTAGRAIANPSLPAYVLIENLQSPRRYLERSGWISLSRRPWVTQKLLRSPSVADRKLLAQSPLLDRESLAALASDPAEDVRFAVAMNPATPREILERLTTDPSAKIRRRANANLLFKR